MQKFILNIMCVLVSHLPLKMFGYVIVFCPEEIQNLSQVIIIVKTLQWNSLRSKIPEAPSKYLRSTCLCWVIWSSKSFLQQNYVQQQSSDKSRRPDDKQNLSGCKTILVPFPCWKSLWYIRYLLVFLVFQIPTHFLGMIVEA